MKIKPLTIAMTMALIVSLFVIVPVSAAPADNAEHFDVTITLTPAGTTQNINWNDGNTQVIDLGDATGDVTVSFTNGAAGGVYRLKVIQDATTPRNITWAVSGGSVLWPGGSAPTISTGALAVDLITLVFDGTDYLGKADQNFS